MKRKLCALFALILWSFSAHAQVITTVAGSSDTTLGDGAPATNANLNGPYSVTLDGIGNFYIADGYRNRIRKVDAAGIITTVAGTGVQGYNGDGIPATAAQLYRPAGIIADHSGNLYFADAFNNRVRKIDTAGIITTVAGNGSIVYNGDNIMASAASLYGPHSMALDAHGNLYITDFEHHRIRKVSTSGTITSIAGTGVAGYTGDNGPADTAKINYPYGIVIDDTGNIYFADDFENVVRKIDRLGIITTFAGGGAPGPDIGDNGPAGSAQLNGPAGLAIDASGNVYIADIHYQRIRKVTVASGIITTVAGNGILGFSGDNGPATVAELSQPTGVAVDSSGSIYIADFGNNRIRRVGWKLDVDPKPQNIQSLSVYPNPATSLLNVASDSSIYNLVITNLPGKVVYKHDDNASSVQINVAGLPGGMYFVLVNGTGVGKFVKE